MTALADFLLARIAEDEEVARAAAAEVEAEGWNVVEIPYEGLHAYPRPSPLDNEGGLIPVSAHMQRHDPARILAECEAKRRIIALYEDWPVFVDVPETVKFATEISYDTVSYRISRQMGWLTTREYVERFGTEPPTGPILLALAEVYSDHPDYQPDWAPIESR